MMRYVSVDKLRPHEENAKIYGDSFDGELLEKIRKVGILTPLLVSSDAVIISGHRRWACAKELGIQEIPAVFFESLDENDILEAMIMANEQRERTTEQKAREFARLKVIEQERAAARQKELAGTRPSKDLQENVPEGVKGQARDLAAQRVGMSGKAAEKAAAVVEVIDALEVTGEKDRAEGIRERLNKSVNGAFRDVQPEIEKKQQVASEIKDAKFEIEHIDDQLAICRSTNKDYKPKFNLTNESINWAAWSWNPVTGCWHDCEYCYARAMACNEYYKDAFPTKFKPTFHPGRLTAPENTSIPSDHGDKAYSDHMRRVFVCSMADLFGEWVPEDWILQVIDACDRNPQWEFLFLTKNPRRYLDFNFPLNCWLGATCDTQERTDDAMDVFRELKDDNVKNDNILFASCEPLMEEIWFNADMELLDLVIIGALKNSENTDRQPKWEWIERILLEAGSFSGVHMVFKPNLTVRPESYPESRMPKQKGKQKKS